MRTPRSLGCRRGDGFTLAAVVLSLLSVGCNSGDGRGSGPPQDAATPGDGATVRDTGTPRDGDAPDAPRRRDGGRDAAPSTDAGAADAGDGGAGSCEDCDGDGECEDLRRDDDHCGVCGRSCGGLDVCRGGECNAPLDDETWTGLGAPALLVADGSGAYWIRRVDDNEHLRTVAHDDAEVSTLATVGSSFGEAALSLTPTAVLWVRYDDGGSTVHRVPKDGGSMGSISSASATLNADQQPSLVSSSGWVLWGSGDGIRRAPLEGGSSELWRDTACVDNLTARDGFIYAACSDGRIEYGPVSASADDSVASVDGGPRFALDDEHLYYETSAGLHRRRLTATASVPTFADPELVAGPRDFFSSASSAGLVLDSDNVYFGIDAPLNVMHRAPKGGGEAEAMWTASHLALGGPWMYWTQDGRVYRTAR